MNQNTLKLKRQFTSKNKSVKPWHLPIAHRLLQYITILLLILPQHAVSQDIKFNYLRINEGLSQNSVTSLTQDSLGRIWIGTRDGLNIYDGAEITTLRPIKNDTTSLLSHFITDLVPDHNYIWVTTKNGLSLLNIETLKFTQFPKENIQAVLPYKGKILVGTQNGLFNLNTKQKTFDPNQEISINQTNIQALFTDHLQQLWIGTTTGTYLYKPSDKTLKPILRKNTKVIFEDSEQQIWIGTFDDGVYRLDKQYRILNHYTDQDSETKLANNMIRDIQESPNGDIWIGTFLGLSILDTQTGTITNYRHEKEKANTLSHNSIYTILKDNQGNMWVGTYFGGISYYTQNSNLYKKYPSVPDNGYGLSYNVISEMLEDQTGNLWIATEGGGVNYLNQKKNLFKHYLMKDPVTGVVYNNVKTLCFLNKDTLLAGTHFGGLFMLSVKDGKTQSFLHQSTDNFQAPTVINKIIAYHNDFVLGTQKGVIRFNPQTKRFTPFFSDEDSLQLTQKGINCLFKDSFGKLWIGTEDQGLYTYNEHKNTVTSYLSSTAPHSINNDNIACIYEDRQLRLWIGTFGGGLSQYVRDKDQFINYTMAKDNLSSDLVLSITESKLNYLWIGTSKGLSRFDVEQKRFYNYDHKNGLPLNELNREALIITKDEEIFVGGLDGLVSFKELNLIQQKSLFNLFLTGLWVNNQQVTPGDKTRLLSKDLPYTRSITLHPGQNVFTISYSTNNYIPTNQHKYRYKLDNFDNNWVNAGSQNKVTYTNLKPGTYIFHVQGLSGPEETVIDEKKLTVKILPPLYRTWYAILFYFLSIIALTWWLNSLYRTRIKLIEKFKSERRKKTQLKKINQAKLDFFTNIAHEFRTPLTLITGTLESILEDTKHKSDSNARLKTVYNNTIRLNNLITELLDFRKLENGSLELKITQNKLTDFIPEIYSAFIDYAKVRNIQFTLDPNIPDTTLWFDAPQMQKVLYNVLFNAFKFTNHINGKVSINIKENPLDIDFIISDNGKGIPAEEINRIFDRYYQIDNIKGKNSGQGSGLGLALSDAIVKKHHGQIIVKSNVGEGTTFIIRLLKDKKHFKAVNIFQGNQVKHATPLSPIPAEETETKNHTALSLSDDAPTILIVEDDEEIRALIRNLLAASYKILEATDGQEGMTMAIESQPNLIISDIMMPNLSGLEMCKILKRNIKTSHIPVVLLTARANPESKIEGLETGADDYITKPFDSKLLKTKIKTIIQNRLLIQQKFRNESGFDIKELASVTSDKNLLDQAEKVIEQHIDNAKFNIQDFAKEMGIGRTNLFLKIKGITGLTPNEFIQSVRLKKAAEMILANNHQLNISEIAYAVGFTTPRYFSRCFREHFGVSPSKYGDAT